MTPRQIAFCNHYLETRNAWRSALAAGYSRSTAAKSCWRIMQHPEVAAVIQEGELARNNAIKVAATDSMLRRLDDARDGLCTVQAQYRALVSRIREARTTLCDIERLIGRKVWKPASPNARQVTISHAVDAEHPDPAPVQKPEHRPYPEPITSPVADWPPPQAQQRSRDAGYSPILDWSDVQFPQKPLMDQSYNPFSND